MQVQRAIPISMDYNAAVFRAMLYFMMVVQLVSHRAFEMMARGNGGLAARPGAAGKPPSAIALHHECYHSVKGLISGQMTATAIRRVAAAYVSAWRKGHAILRPFRFDVPLALWLIGDRGRDASLRADGTISLWTPSGRVCIPFTVPPAFQGMLERAVTVNCVTITADPADVDLSDLRWDEEEITGEGEAERPTGGQDAGPPHRLRAWLTVTVEVPDPVGHSCVGVDRGALLALVAVDADDNVLAVSGREHAARNQRTGQIRRRVRQKMAEKKAQKKDTHSLRRLQKRLSRKQRARTRTFSQQAAKTLCAWAPAGAVLALEALILPAAQPAQRTQTRGRLNAWSHGQLLRCIECKAEEMGIPVVSVNPAFSSRNCSRCGREGRRRGQAFQCPWCGYGEHADVNAARNIRNSARSARDAGRDEIAVPGTLPTE